MKRMITLILALMFVLTCATAFAAEPASIGKIRTEMLAKANSQIKNIEVADLLKMMKNKENYVLLDIREAKETGFTIPSKNVKMIPRGLLEWLVGKQIKLDEKIVVYCKSGGRGAFATKLLNDLGYKNAVNLKGGIIAWLEAGKPVSTYIGNITPTGYKYKK